MRIIRLVVSIAVVLLLAWVVLVWVFPWLIKNSPQVCQRWNLHTGICSSNATRQIRNLNDWTKKNVPFSNEEFGDKTLSDAYAGLVVLEEAAREKLGNDRVNLALNNVDQGIKSTEIALQREGFGDKLREIPQNARELLKQARAALDQLRAVFDKTQRRTEDVSNAVSNTKKALDALSSVLPSATPSAEK